MGKLLRNFDVITLPYLILLAFRKELNMVSKISSIEKVFLSILIPAAIVVVLIVGYSLLQFQRIVISPDIAQLFVAMLGLLFFSSTGLIICLFTRLMRKRYGRRWGKRFLQRGRRGRSNPSI